jgi:hypothetical protein
MKTNLNKYKYIVLALLMAFVAGRFTGPKEVETKEIEKIVYKEREIKNEKTRTRSEVRETTLPDGTKIREIIRNRESEENSDTRREASEERSKESKSTNQANWSVGLYSNREIIAGTIDKRLFGGMFVGIYSRSGLPLSKPEFGLGLRLEF